MIALSWLIFVPSIGIFPELIFGYQVKIGGFVVKSE